VLWREARRYRRNDGSLVSVAGLKPDLVLTMGGGARDRGRIAERSASGCSICLIRNRWPTSSRRCARLPGRSAELPPARPCWRDRAAEGDPAGGAADTIWLGGGGRTVPAAGLAAEWMALAGLRQRPVRGERVSLEQLLVRPPAILLRSDYRSGQYSGEQRWLSHPLARRVRGARNVVTDGRPWTCMGPALVPEIERLRDLSRHSGEGRKP
jgi:iron complex transport system substrate-binding protein